MKLIFFDTKKYDRESFDIVNKNKYKIKYVEEMLSLENVSETAGYEGVVAFVNCNGSKDVLKELASFGIKYWFQRSIGYDNIDLKTANKLGIKVFRVSSYSPEAISEFAWALMLALNRNIHLAHVRTSIDKNFALAGLKGRVVFGKTVGVVGAGRIGLGFIKIAKGFGTRVIVFDEYARKKTPDAAKKYGFQYVNKETLFKESDFLSLHCILNDETNYLVNKKTLALMKSNAIIVNTARGGLINTKDLLESLDNKKLRGAGIDVFEKEKGIFFFDKSNDLVPDLELIRLCSHRNVILTPHQAWFTNLAIEQIAEITMQNIKEVSEGNFEKMLSIMPDGKIKNG